MGNEDGLSSAFKSEGTNSIIEFEGGFFSFAFGNEIAFKIDGKHYILNCDSKLFDEVKEKVNAGLSKKELISFWKDKSKEYEISNWSNDFEDLK